MLATVVVVCKWRGLAAGLVAKRCWIGQVLIYGILDVISKAVFGLILMSGASTGYEAI